MGLEVDTVVLVALEFGIESQPGAGIASGTGAGKDLETLVGFEFGTGFAVVRIVGVLEEKLRVVAEFEFGTESGAVLAVPGVGPVDGLVVVPVVVHVVALVVESVVVLLVGPVVVLVVGPVAVLLGGPVAGTVVEIVLPVVVHGAGPGTVSVVGTDTGTGVAAGTVGARAPPAGSERSSRS